MVFSFEDMEEKYFANRQARNLFSRFFCSCSGDYGENDIFDHLQEYQSDVTIPQYLRDMLNMFVYNVYKLRKFSDMDEDGRDLFTNCFEFLVCRNRLRHRLYVKKKIQHTFPMKENMPSLHAFIVQYLLIPPKYDKILLNMLYLYKITDHGINICNSWLNTGQSNPYF